MIRAFFLDARQTLELSSQQKLQVRAIYGEMRGTDDEATRVKSVQELREQAESRRKAAAEARAKMVELLTPEQRAKWKALAGPPFDFDNPDFQPRGATSEPRPGED